MGFHPEGSFFRRFVILKYGVLNLGDNTVWNNNLSKQNPFEKKIGVITLTNIELSRSKDAKGYASLTIERKSLTGHVRLIIVFQNYH